MAAVSAENFQGSASEPVVLMCGGDPALWTEAAWEAWSVAEAELAQAMSVGVRVAAEASVVVFVDEEMAGDFQRNWLTWKFPAGTPVLVLLVGSAAEELWLLEVTRDARVGCVSAWDGGRPRPRIGLVIVFTPSPRSARPSRK